MLELSNKQKNNMYSPKMNENTMNYYDKNNEKTTIIII